MPLKTLLIIATIVLSPFAAFAQCNNGVQHDQQAMSCVVGTVWDPVAATCVPVTSS
jgi:hypothetical protein